MPEAVPLPFIRHLYFAFHKVLNFLFRFDLVLTALLIKYNKYDLVYNSENCCYVVLRRNLSTLPCHVLSWQMFTSGRIYIESPEHKFDNAFIFKVVKMSRKGNVAPFSLLKVKCCFSLSVYGNIQYILNRFWSGEWGKKRKV